MEGRRLTSLALLNVHREIQLNIDEIIDCFALKHPRQMVLADILNSDRDIAPENKV